MILTGLVFNKIAMTQNKRRYLGPFIVDALFFGTDSFIVPSEMMMTTSTTDVEHVRAMWMYEFSFETHITVNYFVCMFTNKSIKNSAAVENWIYGAILTADIYNINNYLDLYEGDKEEGQCLGLIYLLRFWLLIYLTNYIYIFYAIHLPYCFWQIYSLHYIMDKYMFL
ncbi:hypothetical protein ACJX0J_023913, partial [Zea mays]